MLRTPPQHGSFGDLRIRRFFFKVEGPRRPHDLTMTFLGGGKPSKVMVYSSIIMNPMEGRFMDLSFFIPWITGTVLKKGFCILQTGFFTRLS
jgi:hypothetical protein